MVHPRVKTVSSYSSQSTLRENRTLVWTEFSAISMVYIGSKDYTKVNRWCEQPCIFMKNNERREKRCVHNQAYSAKLSGGKYAGHLDILATKSEPVDRWIKLMFVCIALGFRYGHYITHKKHVIRKIRDWIPFVPQSFQRNELSSFLRH